MILDFLYCFDKNFNLQGSTSIYSLLNNVSKKINLHIIHNDLSSLNNISNKITQHENLNKINYYEFSKNTIKLPTIKTHISEATFYRLFIADYLNHDIDNLIYLDADIICNQNPVEKIEKEFIKMKSQNKLLSAYVEATREKKPEYFERLGMKNDNQLNAGVLLVDYKKWQNEDTSNKLLKILNNKGSKLFDYDQEILNIYFDDDFSKLDKSLNYQVTNKRNLDYFETVNNNAIFIHYLGKDKPWDFFRILIKTSMFYQNEYKKLNSGELHITFPKNKRSFYRFAKILFTLKFLKFEYPFLYLKHSFIAIFKK